MNSRVRFTHGVDVNGNKFTVACTAVAEKVGTKFIYGITACCPEDNFDYKEGRRKALEYLSQKPYSYTTMNDEKPEPHTVETHLKRFVRKFEHASVRKFIAKVRKE